MFTDDGSPGNDVDQETEQWPVADHLRSDLDNIKWGYRATPLSVFARNAFVEARNVNEIITGALVEMHFELYHFCIRASDQDSFNGRIQQILVLQPGKTRPITAYKRKNVRDGPIRLNLTNYKRNKTQIESHAECSNAGTTTGEENISTPTQHGVSTGRAGGSVNETDCQTASTSSNQGEFGMSPYFPSAFAFDHCSGPGGIPTLTLIDLRQTEDASPAEANDEECKHFFLFF